MEQLPLPPLGQGEVLIEVSYTSLSYKDSLTLRGIRVGQLKDSFVLGTDAVGTIVESMSEEFMPGDKVLSVANSLGTSGAGGLSEYLVCLDSEIVRVPAGWTELDSVSIGTPGLTASLALIKLGAQSLNRPEHLVVSGASGAVGSLAIELAAGFGITSISAITGKAGSRDKLINLGATSILNLEAYKREVGMKLLAEQWDCGIDVLGGSVLDNIFKSTRRGGKIVSVGRALADKATLSLAPLYLRSVALVGANLEFEFPELRDKIFDLLQTHFPRKSVELNSKIYQLSDVSLVLDGISDGGLGHRCVIRIKGAWS